MNILIVHENPEMRETIAHLVQNQRAGIGIVEVACLDAAKEHLDWIHAVLASDTFYTHGPGRGEPAEVCRGNWAPLMMACEKADVPFVLIGSQRNLVQRMRAAGHHAFPLPGELLSAIQAAVELAEIKSFDAEVLDIEERSAPESVRQPISGIRRIFSRR